MAVEINVDGVWQPIAADAAFAQAVYPGQWRTVDEPTPQAPELPTVVITDIGVDPAHADRAQIAPDFSALKLPVGATVTIAAELRMAGQRIPGFAAEFAMPLRSSDGLMRYLDVRFVDGATTFGAVMLDSKRWEATQELINSNLPAEAHMQFAGVLITAVEGMPV